MGTFKILCRARFKLFSTRELYAFSHALQLAYLDDCRYGYRREQLEPMLDAVHDVLKRRNFVKPRPAI